MFGAFIGGWEIMLVLFVMVFWLVIIGGIIAIVVALSKGRNKKQTPAPPSVDKQPVSPGRKLSANVRNAARRCLPARWPDFAPPACSKWARRQTQ